MSTLLLLIVALFTITNPLHVLLLLALMTVPHHVGSDLTAADM